MIKKAICISLFIGALSAKAQDMHFSHFNEHYALINPALTGATSEYRAVLGYKNQWRTAAATPYKTYGASFETKVLGGKWKRADELPKKHREQDVGRLGAGLSVYRDKAGEGDMGLTQANLSIAGYVPTGHWSFLSMGIQSSIAFRRVDQTTLIFPNQYTIGGYDTGLNSGEEIPLERYRYMDFAGGMLWSYGYTEKNFIGSKQTKAKFGFAAYHLTQPNLRVIGRAEEKLYMKYVAHGDMLFSIRNSYVALAPSFLFQMQGSSRELMAGATVKYYLSNNTRFTGNVKSTCLNFGLYYRSGDAIITQFMVEYEEEYAFGFSYDFNISPLRKANKLRGGPEFVIRITPQESFLYQSR
jgi:type IX secretion system PorP/SprF family membrane protein